MTNTTRGKIIQALEESNLPGYILGLNRIPVPDCDKLVSHIYRGTFNDPGDPLCPKGWNRGKDSYSIWRNNVGKGICKNCLKKLYENLP